MLTTKTVIGKIEVLETGHIQVRTDTIILSKDAEVSRLYHRHVLAPGDDISNEDPTVQSVAITVWTPNVLATYRANKLKMETTL